MSKFNNLLTSLEEGILTIIINREAKLNALNIETFRELRETVEQVYQEAEIKGVVVTGAGEKAFVAGADITEFTGLDQLGARKLAENGQQVFQMIENCPKPVIAAVNGFALGGGCELAMACHIRVAMTKAKFGQPEVNLGIIPGYGGTQRLTHLVGKSRAMELMMTGEMITADQALQYGLVSHLTETQDEMLTKSNQILQSIFSKAPLAVGQVIKCVNTAFDPEARGYQTEATSFAQCATSDDFKEGTTAFLEKRAPKFKGQ